MKITIIDYGAGNLRSVCKAFEAVGANVSITDQPEEILAASKIVLPGVGAFAQGMQGLAERNLISPLKDMIEKGTPFLGICLGMQLLFETGKEAGEHAGLGLLPGSVLPFLDDSLKIPHTGWNQLEVQKENALLNGIQSGDYVYFNHGYYCQADEKEDVLTATRYGVSYTSAVQEENIYGVQFHPEKSQQVGLKILRNFVERCA